MKRCNLKRAVSLLLSLVLAAGIVFAAIPNHAKAADGDVVFTTTADKEILRRGDKVTVTVSMSGGADAYGIQYEFEYDTDKLQLESAEEGTIIKNVGGGMNFGSLNPYEGGVSALVTKTTAPVGTGSVMKLTFTVLDTAATGSLTFTQGTVMASTETSTSIDCSCVDQTNIRIILPATGISLNKSATEIAKGQAEQLIAELTPAGADSTVTWASSNEAVASVAADGTITANSAGKAVITATAEGKSASCTVNVTVPLNGITVTGANDTHTIKKGQTVQLGVTYDPADTTENKAVTWESSNASIASVDRSGLVTAVADGSATITAKVGNKTADYSITVKEVKLTSISVKSTATIHRGDSETLTVTYDPADTTDDKTVRWTSSDDTKVKVDGSGKVTAVAIGGADITATVGSFTATCRVTVDAPLQGIVPAKNALDMVKNQTATITYTLNPADTTDPTNVTFTSSAPDIAAVNSSTGEVTAKKEGSAVITLSGANGKTAEVTVNVTEIPIDRVTLNKQNAVVEKGETVELTASVEPDNTTDDDTGITWTSSDPTVATVSPSTSASGAAVTVTATNKGGTATITASAANGTKADFKLTVLIHMDGISLPAAATINRGTTEVLKVTYSPANTTDDKTVRWTSDNTAVAKVDPDTGVITALKEGTANITATTTKTSAPYSAVTNVTVQENHLNTAIGNTIEFEDMDAPVLRGQQYNMYRQMNLAKLIQDNGITDDITIQWSSSAPETASVDQSGNVTGLKKGKTTITAVITARDGNGNQTGEYTVSTEIDIKEIPLDSIAFNKVITEMQVGATDVLGIIYNPADTTDLKDVEWSSSDPNVISVDNGRLTAHKIGIAEITAKVGDKMVTCKITVKDNGNTGAGGNGTRNTGVGGTNTRNGSRAGVQTGDTANIALYLVLLLLSFAVAAVICYTMRSRRMRR